MNIVKELDIKFINGEYRTSTRKIGKVVGYSNTVVRNHVKQLKSILDAKEHEKMFVNGHYYQPLNKMVCEEYWVSVEGLKILKDNWKRYEEARSLAFEMFNMKNDNAATLKEEETPRSINEVINIKEENGEILISGRELHEFLEIDSNYTTWLARMIDYGFERDIDFVPIMEESTGGRPRTDHAMKVDMAKEISMLQRNAKGKQARIYFIECERKLKAQPQQPVLPTTYKDALVALIAEVEAREKLQAENKQQQEVIEVMKPKSEYCDMVLMADGTVTVSIIAKDYGMSATAMNKLLQRLGIQYKQGNIWLLYREHQDKGYAKSETHVVGTARGDIAAVNTKWTQLGRLFIYDTLKEHGILPTMEQN